MSSAALVLCPVQARPSLPLNRSSVHSKASASIASVVPSAQRGGWLYASSATGQLYTTADGGRQWDLRTRHAPGWVIAVVDRQSHDLLLAANVRGLFASDDGGRSWKTWSSGLEVASVAAADRGHIIWVAAGEDFRTGAGGGLYRIWNFGRSWTSFRALPRGNRNVNEVLVDPENSDVVYAATEAGGLLRSTDGGRHFEWRTVGLPRPGFPHGEQITSLTISRSNPSVVWAGTRGGGVWRGIGEGRFWAFDGLGARYVDYLAADQRLPDHVFAGESGVVSSRASVADGGRTYRRIGARAWEPIQGLPGEWHLEISAGTNTLYAWRGHVIKTSRDHGRTWATVPRIP